MCLPSPDYVVQSRLVNENAPLVGNFLTEIGARVPTPESNIRSTRSKGKSRRNAVKL
jgi:hypothetical protein